MLAKKAISQSAYDKWYSTY